MMLKLKLGWSKFGVIIRIMTFLKKAGELPGILTLFAHKPKATKHLSRFTHEIMRGKGELPTWFRELIAAYTSSRNQCPF